MSNDNATWQLAALNQFTGRFGHQASVLDEVLYITFGSTSTGIVGDI